MTALGLRLFPVQEGVTTWPGTVAAHPEARRLLDEALRAWEARAQYIEDQKQGFTLSFSGSNTTTGIATSIPQTPCARFAHWRSKHNMLKRVILKGTAFEMGLQAGQAFKAARAEEVSGWAKWPADADRQAKYRSSSPSPWRICSGRFQPRLRRCRAWPRARASRSKRRIC